MYCCAFLDETTAWVAGAYGQILSIDLAATKPTFFKLKQRNGARRHINAIAVSQNGKRIFCAGGWSHLAALRKSGSVSENYVTGRTPTTPPASRSALSHYASDQAIHHDIFDPGSLKRETIVELDELLGEADFVSCAHSPEMPISCGTNESIVLLIDTRDGQIFQEIEVSKGAPARSPVSFSLGRATGRDDLRWHRPVLDRKTLVNCNHQYLPVCLRFNRVLH